jgi:hypothetical protein
MVGGSGKLLASSAGGRTASVVEEGIRRVNTPEHPEGQDRRYAAGDVIELRLSLTHQQNLESVWAVYGREGREENTITFQGEVDDTTQIESEPEGDRPLPRKRSVVVLRMVVDIDHRPGHYQLLEAGCRSVSGEGIHLRTHDTLRPGALSGFDVVEEPFAAPWADLDFIDDTEEDEAE